MPTNLSKTYSAPDFNLNVELTNKGSKISLDLNPVYEYNVFSIVNNQVAPLGKYSDYIYDDTVFKFDKIEYYAVAKNKYTNISHTSDKVTIYPQSYLVEMLNNNFI